MRQDNFPTFLQVYHSLRVLEALGSAAQVHGLLCALMAAGAKIRKQAWVNSVYARHIEAGDIMAIEAQNVLERLYDGTKAHFQSEQCEFYLLLPEDDAPMSQRLEALVDWSQGFLSGLKMMGMESHRLEDKELGEALEDLTQIACLSYQEEMKDKEEEEKAYTELVEYIKLVVLNLFQEHGQVPSQKIGSSSGQIH